MRRVLRALKLTKRALQIPIKAGHEFIVSTEDKYAESGDDKVLYVDYVSYRDRVVLIRH